MMKRPDKLDCPDVELLLAEYAARELAEAQADVVGRHLEGCPACAAELAREQTLRQTVAGLPVLPCPHRTTQVITQERENGRPPRKGLLQSLWPAAAGLAAAAVLLLILLPDGGDNMVIDSDGQTWQRTELESARAELQWTLALTAGVIERTERNTMAEVFGHKLPRTLNGSLRRVLTNVQGGQG